MKKYFLIIIALLFAINAYAQPSTISYQGVLTDAGGTVITGTPNIAFALFDAATNGNQLWTETHNNVTVTNGLFQVELNSVATNWGTANFATDMWLQITVGATTLTPRVKLNANGYSFRSAQATSATNATSATTATNIAGGGNGSIPYQTASGTTTMLAAGTNGHVLTLAGGVPTWAAPSGGSGNTTIYIFKTADQSVSNSIALVDCNDLAFSWGNNPGTYIIEGWIYMQQYVTEGTRLNFTTLGGGTPTLGLYFVENSSAVNLNTDILYGDTDWTGAFNFTIICEAPSDVTGIKLRFAQKTSGPNPVTLKKGSYIRYTKVN